MTCKNCKWLSVEPDKDGKVRIRKELMYICTVPIEMPKFPISITKEYDFKWPPRRTRVSPNDNNCPMFEDKK